MPTLRSTCVFVTALILALSASATHAVTPTPTRTPPGTPTSTACAGEPARLNPVTSPTDLLQQTITGSGRPLEDAGGSHSIYVITPAGVFYAFSSLHDFPFSTYAATVDLVPGVNHLTVCQTSVVCAVVPCTSYDLDGNPLQIIVNPPTPTDTPTPTPTVNECNPSTNDCPDGKQCICCCGTFVCMPPYLPCCALPCSEPTQVSTPTPSTSPTPIPTTAERICGHLVQGIYCALLQADTDVAGTLHLLSNDGGFYVGDHVCVTGERYPCTSICQQGDCFNVTMIEAIPTSTPMPVPGECGSVCDGRPCSGFLIRSGTCQPDDDQCTCVPNTPAPGECALACDGRPCVGQCPDGSTASGFCTYLTVDTGCRCALECSMPTPTPTSAAVPCVGDCGGDRVVSVDEIVRMVNIALNGETGQCPGSDQWCSSGPVLGAIGITCLIDAVNNLLSGCPTPPPTFSLSVHVARNPDTHILQAVADLTNTSEVFVSYLAGCSAECQPKVYQTISFHLIGPNGTEVIVEDPCGNVLLCPEAPRFFSPGESVEQRLDLTGTEFIPDTPSTGIAGYCGTCTQTPLEPGRYTVTARFQYSTDLNNPWPFPDHIEASTEFDWP